MKQTIDQYLIRPSFFNLVELSLLANMYERNCLPAASSDLVNKESLAQTLLKMKASENSGRINVLLYQADPVGFYWEFEGEPRALWVEPTHKSPEIIEKLKS